MPYAGPSGGNAKEVMWGSNPLNPPVQRAPAPGKKESWLVVVPYAEPTGSNAEGLLWGSAH